MENLNFVTEIPLHYRQLVFDYVNSNKSLLQHFMAAEMKPQGISVPVEVKLNSTDRGVVEDLSRTIGDFSMSMEGLTTQVRSFSAIADVVTKFLDDSSLPSFTSVVLNGLSILFDLIVMSVQKSLILLPSIALRFLALVGLPTSKMGELFEWLKRLVYPKQVREGTTDESGDVFMDAQMHPQVAHPVSIGALLCGVVGTVLFGSLPSLPTTKRISEQLRMFNLMLPAVDQIGTLLFEIVDYLPKVVEEWIKDQCPAEWWLSHFEKTQPFYAWAAEVAALNNPMSKQQASYFKPLQDTIIKLRENGILIMEEAAERCDLNGKAFAYLSKTAATLDELYQIATDARGARGAKATPYCIYFYGAPGRGKSTLANYYSRRLCPTGAFEDNMVYSRNCAMAHWDGYTGQHTVILNDFAQVMSPVGNNDPMMEYISMMDNVQYYVPMANLNKKGEVFSSKVVIVTSNQAYPRPNDLASPEALWRRRNLLVRVYVAPEYMIGNQVDVDRLPSDDSHYRFDVMHPLKPDGAVIAANLTLEELDKRIMEDYHHHLTRESRTLQKLVDLSNHPILGKRMDVVMSPQMMCSRIADPERYASPVPEEFLSADEGEEKIPKVIPLKFDKRPKCEDRRRWSLTEWLNHKREAVNKSQSHSDGELDELNCEMRVEKKQWLDSWPRVKKIVDHLKVFAGALALSAAMIAGVIAVFVPVSTAVHKVVRKRRGIKCACSWFNPWCEVCTSCEDNEVKAQQVERWCQNSYDDYMEKFGKEHPALAGAYKVDWRNPRERTRVVRNFYDSFLNDGGEIEAQGGAIASGDFKTRRAKIRAMRAQGTENDVVFTLPSEAFQRDLCMEDVVTHRVLPHMALIELVNPGDQRETRKMQAFFLRGKIILIPQHFFYMKQDGKLVPDGTLIRIIHESTEPIEIGFQKKNLVLMPEKDCALYDCGARIRSYRDNVCHFISRDDLPRMVSVDAHLFSNRGVTTTVTQVNVVDWDIVSEYDIGGHPIFVRRCWRYMGGTIDGDCGGILVASGKIHPRKIMGMHIAGDEVSQVGMSDVVTQEDLLEALGKLNRQVIGTPLPGPLQTMEKAILVPQGNFSFGGVLPRSLGIRVPEKTDIIPSRIYELLFDHSSEPSVMTSKDKRCLVEGSPLVRGASKFGAPTHPMNQEIIEEVIRDLANELISLTTHSDSKRILTLSEAINGTDEEYVDSLNMQSSPGWPFVLKRPNGGGKEFLFCGDIGKKEISDMELAERVENRIACAKKGERVESVWTDCIKDERGAKDKIARGKTRVFTICPVDYTIVGRMYYLNFCAFLIRNRLKCFSAIGIDPHSQEWTTLMMRLLKVSTRGFAGDYSNWDGTLSPQMMLGFCEVVNLWYGGTSEDNDVRRVLIDEMTHTVQLMMTTVYVSHQGSPSGTPLTSIVNTVVNEMYLRYCWLVLAPEDKRTLFHYHQAVASVIYGDDNVVAVSRPHLWFFNAQTLASELGKYGITYTMTDKTSEIVSDGDIEEVSFLKRRFRRRGKWYLPLLEPNTIRELTNWIRECSNPAEMTYDNCCEALSYTSFYGEKEYNRLYFAMVKALKQKHIHKILPQYSHFYWQFRPLLAPTEECEVDMRDVTCAMNRNYAMRGRNLMMMCQMKPQMADGSYGIRFEDQRDLISQEATEGAMVVSNSRASSTMQDLAWDLKKMVNRPSFVQTLTWTTSSIVGANLLTLKMPKDIITSNLAAAPFQRFLYWNGSMKVRFQLNSTRFHVGTLIAYYVPLTPLIDIQKWHGMNFAARTSVQYVLLDAAVSSTVELVIPYINPSNFLKTTELDGLDTAPPYNYLGYVLLDVLNPLLVTTGGPTSLDITVFGQIGEDSVFKVPIEPTVTGGVDVASTMRQAQMRPQGNTITTYSTQKIKNYGEIADIANPNNVTGDAFDVKAKVSGMDKPAITVQPNAVVLKASQYMTHGTNIEFINRLALHPGGTNTSDFEHFGTTQDEMSLRYLTGKSNLFRSVNWSATDVENTILTSGWVGPCQRNAAITTADLGAQIEVTTLDYTSMAFTFWRGGINMRIRISASQFHSGRLFLGFHPGTWFYPSTLNGALAQYGVVIDLQNQAREWEYVFPFVYPLPWCRVCNESIEPSSPAQDPEDALKYFTGTWTLRVLNKLVTTTAAPSQAYVNMFIGGGEDFELAYPSLANQSITPISPYFSGLLSEAKMKPQMAEVPTVEDDTVGQMLQEQASTDGPPLGPTRNFVTSDNHFGEKYTSIRDLCKRYFCLTSFSPDFRPLAVNGYRIFTSSATPILVGVPIGIISGDGNNCPYRGAMGWFGYCFRLQRGSMRYKVMYDQPPTGQLQYSPQRTFVTFDPSTTYFNADPSFPDSQYCVLPSVINGVVGPTSWNLVVNSTDSVKRNAEIWPNCRSMAIDVADMHAPYNEVEVPFQTAFNTLPITPMFGNTGAPQAPPDVYAEAPQYIQDSRMSDSSFVGGLLIQTTSLTNGLSPDASGQGNPAPYGLMNVFQAAGDDWRMGVFVGPPFVWVKKISLPSEGTPPTSNIDQCYLPDRYFPPLPLRKKTLSDYVGGTHDARLIARMRHAHMKPQVKIVCSAPLEVRTTILQENELWTLTGNNMVVNGMDEDGTEWSAVQATMLRIRGQVGTVNISQCVVDLAQRQRFSIQFNEENVTTLEHNGMTPDGKFEPIVVRNYATQKTLDTKAARTALKMCLDRKGKTAITVLNELQTAFPQAFCFRETGSMTGPPHAPMITRDWESQNMPFVFTVSTTERTKSSARQIAAEMMLDKIQERSVLLSVIADLERWDLVDPKQAMKKEWTQEERATFDRESVLVRPQVETLLNSMGFQLLRGPDSRIIGVSDEVVGGATVAQSHMTRLKKRSLSLSLPHEEK